VRSRVRLLSGRVAVWLNAAGVSAFVLKYRLQEYGCTAPLRDVLRAVRLLRSQAARRKVAAERMGVMRSSAGGHPASSAGTVLDSPESRTGAERVSRPDRRLAEALRKIDVRARITRTGPQSPPLSPEPDFTSSEGA
jgi:hypothetical protein